MGTQPYQKLQARYQTWTRVRVPCPPEVIRYQPSEQAEALQPDSCVQDQDRSKNRRIGGIEKRKRERSGKRSIKSPVPSLVKALWPAIHVRRRPGTKWPQLWPLGLVHQCGWAGLRVPRVVRTSVVVKKRSHQSRHLLQEGKPLPGSETGLLFNIQKWIIWGDTHANKARVFIGKGHPDTEPKGKGTQGTGSQSQILW